MMPVEAEASTVCPIIIIRWVYGLDKVSLTSIVGRTTVAVLGF